MLDHNIIEFFAVRKIGVNKLIQYRQPPFLTAAQVEEAAALLYQGIQDGTLHLHVRQMPRWIWKKAFECDGGQYAIERIRQDNVIGDLENRMMYLEGHLEEFGFQALFMALLKVLFYSPEGFDRVGV